LRPAPFRTRRARVAAAAFGALSAALVAAPSAFAGLIAPESGGGSPNAEHIKTLYLIAFALGVLIFLLVEGVLIYSLMKFRWRRGGEPPAQIRGNTKLEVGWTIGAASILVVLTVVTFLYLDDIQNPPASGPNGLRADAGQFASIDQPSPPTSGGPTLTIHVNGQQYIWRYDYPGNQQLFSYNEMVVPTDTTVVLKIESSDVIHSWWIPKFGPKADAVPGHVNETWFKVPAGREGIYRGQCAELCGSNHADMRATVRAVKPDEFQAWAQAKRDQIKAAGEAVAKSRKEREKAGAVE
jgi:cytochrome c oxidase subunit 2